MYGYLHRGRVLSFDAVTGGWNLSSIGLARTSRWGPVPSAVPGLQVGDQVILGAHGTSRDDLVIIAKVGADFPDIGDIPGLTAALAAKADDSDITAINGEIDAIDDTLDDHEDRIDALEPAVADHESRLDVAEPIVADHETRLDTAEPTIVTHTSRITALEFSSSVMDRDLYNDRIASMRRLDVTGAITLANGTMYATRMFSRRAIDITTIRMATAVAGTVGTCAIGLYTATGSATNNFALTRSGSITLTTLGRVNHTLSSLLACGDSTNFLVVLIPASFSVAPQIGGKTGVVHSSLLNPAGTTAASVTKTGTSLPATIDLTDGTWALTPTSIMWVALT